MPRRLQHLGSRLFALAAAVSPVVCVALVILKVVAWTYGGELLWLRFSGNCERYVHVSDRFELTLSVRTGLPTQGWIYASNPGNPVRLVSVHVRDIPALPGLFQIYIHDDV